MTLNLPTLAEQQAKQFGQPLPKGPSRLQKTVEARPLTKVDEKTFKAAVWLRDKSHCRMCERKVIKTLSRVLERGEVEHLHGRGGERRFDARTAMLACCQCHEKLTGRVNERWTVIPSARFEEDGRLYIDARQPLKFVRIV